MIRYLLGLFAAVLVLTGAPSHATVIANWSVERVMAEADSVVLGRVLHRRSIVERGRILTESTVEVSEQLRGPALARIVVTQLGGAVGDVRADVAGVVHLQVGQKVVLATRRAADGRRYIVGMSLGAYVLDGQTLRQTISVPLQGRDGQLREAPGLRTLQLDQLRQTLRVMDP